MTKTSKCGLSLGIMLFTAVFSMSYAISEVAATTPSYHGQVVLGGN